MTTRLKPVVRKQQILEAALHVAERDGYMQMTREGIANHAGVSTGLVSKYLGTMKRMRRTVMRHAVAEEIPGLVAQGIIAGDPHAMRASAELKHQAAVYFMRGDVG